MRNRFILPVGFAALVGLPLVFLVAGLFLPSQVEVELAKFFPVSPEVLYARLDSAEEWVSYQRVDRRGDLPAEPSVEITGLAEGVGSGFQLYFGDDLVASYTIREAIPVERIGYGFSFAKAPVRGRGEILLRTAEGGTLLTRRETAEIGLDPVYRWLALGLSDAVMDDFEVFMEELGRDIETTPSTGSPGPVHSP